MAIKPVEIDKEDEIEIQKARRRLDEVEKKYTILNKYWPLIEENLPKNESKLFRAIAMYRNNNLSKLETPYFTDYPVWKVEDEQIVFDTIGVSKREAETDIYNIERPEFYKIKKFNITAVHIILLLFMRYYRFKKEEKKVQMLFYYFAYSMYWMAYTKSFPRFKPSPEVIVYTVNNLSNRFKLKIYGTINGMLYYGVSSSIDYLWDYLEDSFDYALIYIADNIRTRIGGYVKQLSGVVYENVKNQNMTFEGSEHDKEGNVRPPTSNTSQALVMADEKTTQFFSNPPRNDIINRVAAIRGISRGEIKNILLSISDNQTHYNEVHTFYESLFYVYFNNTDGDIHNIHSLGFINEMDKIYRKGNTSDKNINTIKEILNSWLESASKIYQNASRAALKNDYRKAIFMYFVYEIASNK